MKFSPRRIPREIGAGKSRLLLAIGLLVPLQLAFSPGAGGAGEDIPVAEANLFGRLDTDGDRLVRANELAPDQQWLFQRLLRLGDENNDQALDESEWRSALHPRRPPKPIEEKTAGNFPGAEAVRLLLLKIDTDRNGLLTAEEVPSELRPLFEQMVSQIDRNADGQVNRRELARAGPQLSRLALRLVRRSKIDVSKELRRLDKAQGSAAHRFDDEPTVTSQMSGPKQALAIFKRLDTNKDGQISRDEVQGRLAKRFDRADRNNDGLLDRDEIADHRAALATQPDRKKQGD